MNKNALEFIIEHYTRESGVRQLKQQIDKSLRKMAYKLACNQELKNYTITRGVNKNHIIRATMESLAYQVNDILVAMQADSGIKLAALNVDGGASANNLLMQMQSDISGAPVQRPTCVETTAMGAAYLAGLAVGYWASKEDVVHNRAIDRVFHPEISEEERAEKVKGWNKAVKCAYGWAKD